MRRRYEIQIFVNSRKIKEVLIDPHYEKKHSKSINDNLILSLVTQLDNGDFDPEMTDMEFEYYTTKHFLEMKCYKLVWLLNSREKYIGIINAYRSKK